MSGEHERVVEYPWVISKLTPGASVLDVGTVAPPILGGYEQFVFQVTRRLGCRYVTLDVMPGANLLGDIREIELPNKSFDFVVAVSTLEHITIRPWDAWRNMTRIGKRVLATLPYGLGHDMPWGFNYGPQRLVALIGITDPVKTFFGHFDSGWRECEEAELRDRPYWAHGSGGASGVVCLDWTP